MLINIKKTLLTLLLTASIMFAYDTHKTQVNLKNTNQQTEVHIKDTVITNPIDNRSFWLKYLPIVAPIIAIIISMIITWVAVYSTNKNQRKIAKDHMIFQSKMQRVQIDVASSRKLIDDLINVYTTFELSKLEIEVALESIIDRVNKIELPINHHHIISYELVMDDINIFSNNIETIRRQLSNVQLIMPLDYPNTEIIVSAAQKLLKTYLDVYEYFIQKDNYDYSLERNPTLIAINHYKNIVADDENFMTTLKKTIEDERDFIRKKK